MRRWDVACVPMYLVPDGAVAPTQWAKAYVDALEQGWEPIGSAHAATEDRPEGRVGIIFGLMRREVGYAAPSAVLTPKASGVVH